MKTKLKLVVGVILLGSLQTVLAQGMRISPEVGRAVKEHGGPHAGTEKPEKPDRAPAAAPAARATPAAKASPPAPAERSAADKAVEKAEKAADRLTEVRSRPHTAAEEGKAFSDAAKAKQEAEKELAKP